MQNYKTNCFNGEISAIKCGDQVINFETPIVMGILNITPDSFYDGGNYTDETSILHRAEQILAEGADIIDIGAYSTRPGAADVSIEEELQKITCAVRAIRKEFSGAVLSIDTFRSEVALKIVQEFGSCLVNDISGGTMDEKMFETISGLRVPYIMMHIQGTPETMQKKPFYKDLMGELKTFFAVRIKHLHELGVKDIILDPGFGFGKTLDHNYEIVGRLQEFQEFKLPILAGLSRKSMIYKYLGGNPGTSLNGTTALNMVCLNNGASILRVHDVREAVDCVKIHTKIKSQS